MKILSIIDSLNWFARIDGLLHGVFNFRHSKHHKKQLSWEPGLTEFRVNRMGEFSGVDCDRMLADYGIATHGKRVTSDEFIFSVPSHRANHTAYILARAHVDTTKTLPVNVSPDKQNAGLPPTWKEKRWSSEQLPTRVKKRRSPEGLVKKKSASGDDTFSMNRLSKVLKKL